MNTFCLFVLAARLLACGFAFLFWTFCNDGRARPRWGRRTNVAEPDFGDAVVFSPSRRKPKWVRRKVLYLATHLHSCRQIAATFNRWHGGCITVGKTWVWEFINEHRAEIERLRRERRRREPLAHEVGHTWALDLTFVPRREGRPLPVLGIVDCGSRKALCLRALASKCTLILLGHLLLAVARFGAPKAIRTDNEGMFASHLWRRALALLLIAHRRGPPAQPWRNGRIERLFGTLKPLLARLQPSGSQALDKLLVEFTWFYNRLRPHQALGGLTPDERWRGMTMQDVQRFHRGARGRWVEAIGGLLTAYWPDS